MRHVARALLAAISVLTAPVSALAAESLSHTLTVPLDYAHLEAGKAELTYEFGAAFDPTKPTVIIVADGQQFFVAPGAAADLQHKLFGDDVNVVGLITRGSTPAFVKATLGADGKVDWVKAWHVFNVDQWIGDIESVREAVVDRGPVMLYGRSGGAYLVHQYLAAHGDHVSRAFTQSPVNPLIARQLGIPLDRYWETLGREDPDLRPLLLDALRKRPAERTAILLTLQRQHFYVPDDKLKAERARLIRALAAGDEAVFTEMRKAYEVESIEALMQSNDSIPQDVRVVELIGPSGAFETPDDQVSPLIEPQRNAVRGLLDLEHAGRIPAPGFDLTALSRVPTEVFILAGRDDEAVDYRTTIALAYAYPRHALFIADDNHNFAHLVQAGDDSRLIQGFFRDGLGSKSLDEALAHAAPLHWTD